MDSFEEKEWECCPKCTKRSPFHHVIDIYKDIAILRHAESVVHQVPVGGNSKDYSQFKTSVRKKTTTNSFIIVNNSKDNFIAIDINTAFDINKVKCPRCRYRAEKALTLFPNKINLKRGDIRGICDHCRNEQLSEKLCFVCEAIVKKFIRITQSTQNLPLRKTAENIENDISFYLDSMKTKTELYKPKLTVAPPNELFFSKEKEEKENLLIDSQNLTLKKELQNVPQSKENIRPMMSTVHTTKESLPLTSTASKIGKTKPKREVMKKIYKKQIAEFPGKDEHVKKSAKNKNYILSNIQDVDKKTKSLKPYTIFQDNKATKKYKQSEIKIIDQQKNVLALESKENENDSLKEDKTEKTESGTNIPHKYDATKEKSEQAVQTEKTKSGTKLPHEYVTKKDESSKAVQTERKKSDKKMQYKYVQKQVGSPKAVQRKGKESDTKTPHKAAKKVKPQEVGKAESITDEKKIRNKDVAKKVEYQNKKDEENILYSDLAITKKVEHLKATQILHARPKEIKSKMTQTPKTQEDIQKKELNESSIPKHNKTHSIKLDTKKDSEIESEQSEKKEDKHKESLQDIQIFKLLPKQQKTKDINVLSPYEAMKLAEQRLAEMQETLLEAARNEFQHRQLPELPTGQYYLFQITSKKGVPQTSETTKKKFKDLKYRSLAYKQFKMRGPSYDNLILKLVKTGQKKRKTTRKIQHRGQYKIRSAKRNISLSSLSIDSDFELEFESLTNLVTAQDIIKDKINNIRIVKNVPDKEKPKSQYDPVLFQNRYDVVVDEEIHNKEEEPEEKPESITYKGILRYKLSNNYFIDNGFTMLPELKVLRKMNIYKVRPANPEFDWFSNNKHKGFMTYDTGEKLAEFDENGRGLWFYKNGNIALDYYDSEDIHAQERFVIYSSGEPDEKCHCMPITILAIFDHLGNGVVFDHNGKIRLKYNQTEGVVLDSGIGPKSHWIWHTLNDPPELKQVMIETKLEHPDPQIMSFGDPNDEEKRQDDEDMLEIECDNHAKDKIKKLKQKFTPYQIKMKSLKINKQMSLRILDQAHVYLYFRDGLTHIKLNLGMILDHQEIIDSETTDVSEVSTCVDHYPPKTDSILNLQAKLSAIRRCERQCTANRSILPISSTDKLLRFVSKPLRRPLSLIYPKNEDMGICHQQTSKSKTDLCYEYRLI